MQKSDSPSGSTGRMLHALIWAASLAVWTYKLLDPQPIPENLKPDVNIALILAKTLHVCGYGWCTLLGLWYWRSIPWRMVYAGFMVWHGIATEIIQSYIPTRFGSEKDVGFNCLGITLACLVTWWWHKRQSRKNSL